MSDPDDDIAEMIRRAAALVPDPDPNREEVACPDCLTPRLVLVERDEGGQMLVIGHDPTCPYYAGLVQADTERVVIDDEHTICHVANGEP
jgi:hypothetical protein